MRSIELGDQTYEALQQLAAAKGVSPAEIIASLVNLPPPATPAGGALLTLLAGSELTLTADPTTRYLALLAWVARFHPADFAEFVTHQESGRRCLALSRDEIREIRQRNHACQIPGTHYWAVMNIDSPSQQRFVRRLLEFIGCRDEIIAVACRALGFAPAGKPDVRPEA